VTYKIGPTICKKKWKIMEEYGIIELLELLSN